MKFKAILIGWILGLFAFSGTAVAEETKKSGEKGGTEDINIGVGELNEGASNSARKKAKKKAATKKMRRKKKPDAVAAEKEYVREDASNSGTKKKKTGKVEATWKVEKGEK
jgi:hypothetical protein